MYVGYVAPGDKFKDQEAIELHVVSELVSCHVGLKVGTQPGAGCTYAAH